MKLPALYFNWLQKDNPTGGIERFPELARHFETTVPGLYCIGDLTGVPLIKPAAESGKDMVDKLHADPSFRKRQGKPDGAGAYDFIIVGGGPAGMAAGMRARELGYRFLILESNRPFNTIENFPRGKPILVTPEGPMRTGLKFSSGTKETLLEELRKGIRTADLPVREGVTVQSIVREKSGFVVETSGDTVRALRVIVAIGKSGNARALGVSGEELPKVFTRLIDPGLHVDEDVLVVGGGDSAVEAAVALAEAGNRVAFSYRKDRLTRPKEPNIEAFDRKVAEGSITPFFESHVKRIDENSVTLATRDGEKSIPNNAVYALIGTEIPIRFFERSKVRMEGEMKRPDYWALVALLLFSMVLYFGKSAPVTPIRSVGDFFLVPEMLFGKPWVYMVKGMLAWVGFLGMMVTGFYLAAHALRNAGTYLAPGWPLIKYSYFALCFLFFGYLYVTRCLQGKTLLGWTMDHWYTALYALTILIFGLRRMRVKPSGYIKRQTWTLIGIQWVPLFLIPVIVLPFLGRQGWLPDWVATHVFPDESYWRAFGFVLAWPLFLWNLATGSPYAFWLIVSLVQTFVIIPYIVHRWGKGAYCGWICSCGALAETLGDEYRNRAPHGARAKKWENAGQGVLWFAGLLTLLVISGTWFDRYFAITPVLQDIYTLTVDVVFAGVLGVGVYFFLSGRVWCRFLCPLAALMHIYARFTRYRIMANKKRCISCNLCTRVCHMGIDVMGFANRGIPMNDVECVRCSSCIYHCPMDALTFGRVDRVDLENKEYKKRKYPLVPGWVSGLPRDRIDHLIAEEENR